MKYDIKELRAEPASQGLGLADPRPWRLEITVKVTGSQSLAEIMTDVERRLGAEGK